MKRNIVLPIVTATVLVVAVLTFALPKILEGNGVAGAADPKAEQFAQGQDVVIKASDISSDASYYDYDANGTKVQLFAVKASDGTARVALNTCQVCQASPKAYFVQNGDNFVCQNCGNSFASTQVGDAAQGCDPIPVTNADYTIKDNTIVVPASFLDQYASSFTNWKKA